MKRRAIGGIAGACLILVLLGLLLRDREPRCAPELAAPRVERELVPVRAEIDAPPHPAEREPVAGGPAVSAADLPVPPEAPVPGGVEVLVVASEDDEPVPDAEVLFLDWDALSPEARDKVASLGRELDRAMAIAGRRFRTDEIGLTRVPQPLVGAQLAARSPGRYGFGHASRDTARALVRLEPDVELPVHVVDGSVRAVAGVVVALRARDEHNCQDLVRATTDVDGRATLRHVQAQRSQAEGMRFCVALTMLAREPVELPLDVGALTRGVKAPLELVLPETGTVEVEVGGDPSRLEHGHLALEVEHDGSAARVPGVPAVALGGARTVARFERVGLGLELLATLHGAGPDPVQVRASGPRASGEVVRMRLEVGSASGSPEIVGRLIAPGGEPLGKARVSLRLSVRQGMVREEQSSSLETDARGGFRFPLRRALAAGESATLRLALDTLGTSLELPAPDAHGRHALGDVVLVVLPLVCAGRTVDELGQGVPGASLHVLRRLAPGIGDPFWDAVAGLDAVSSEDGTFAVRGAIDELELALHAGRTDRVPVEEQEFARGSTGLTVVLTRGAFFAGRLRLPARVEARDLELTLVPERAPERPVLLRPRSDGTFEARNVPLGLATLRVRLRQEPEPFWTVQRVALVPAADARDPRLEPLDLSALLFTFVLTLEDAAGQPVSGASILRMREGGAWVPIALLDEDPDGTYRLVASQAALDLELRARGYRPVRLAGLASDRRIVLARGPRVVLSVLGLSRELCEDFAWSVRCSSTDEAEAELASDLVALQDSVAELGLALPGLHRPRLYASRRAPGEAGVVSSGEWHEVELADAPVLDVRDSAELQPFEISPEPDALARTLAKLRKAR